MLSRASPTVRSLLTSLGTGRARSASVTGPRRAPTAVAAGAGLALSTGSTSGAFLWRPEGETILRLEDGRTLELRALDGLAELPIFAMEDRFEMGERQPETGLEYREADFLVDLAIFEGRARGASRRSR